MSLKSAPEPGSALLDEAEGHIARHRDTLLPATGREGPGRTLARCPKAVQKKGKSSCLCAGQGARSFPLLPSGVRLKGCRAHCRAAGHRDCSG